MSEYLNYRQFCEIMETDGLKRSAAVKLYMDIAAMYNTRKKKLSAVTQSSVICNLLNECEEKRAFAVQNAIDTAQEEKKQGWRYIEDGAEYQQGLLIKYDGDMTLLTDIERKKLDYIETLTLGVGEQAERTRPMSITESEREREEALASG